MIEKIKIKQRRIVASSRIEKKDLLFEKFEKKEKYELVFIKAKIVFFANSINDSDSEYSSINLVRKFQ